MDVGVIVELPSPPATPGRLRSSLSSLHSQSTSSVGCAPVDVDQSGVELSALHGAVGGTTAGRGVMFDLLDGYVDDTTVLATALGPEVFEDAVGEQSMNMSRIEMTKAEQVAALWEGVLSSSGSALPVLPGALLDDAFRPRSEVAQEQNSVAKPAVHTVASSTGRPIMPPLKPAQPTYCKSHPYPVKVNWLAESLRVEDCDGSSRSLPPAPPLLPLSSSLAVASPASVSSAPASLCDLASPCSPQSSQPSPPSSHGSPSSVPSPSVSSVPPTPSSTGTKSSRSARKRQQNKDAAIRYRKKKHDQQERLSKLCEELRAENSELLRKHTRLTNEIAYVKGLLEEVIKARRDRALAKQAKS